MIHDSISNLKKYKGISPALDSAIEYISKCKFENIKCEKLVISDCLYLMNSKYYGFNFNKKYEMHKRYIDIQLVLEGEEFIEYSVDSILTSNIIFENDTFFIDHDEGQKIKLQPKAFIIFFPYELHKPCLKSNDDIIHKIVFKVDTTKKNIN